MTSKKLNNTKHYLISSVCFSKNGSMVWNHSDTSELKMKNFSENDLLVVCSRKIHNLVSSGVNNWRKYEIINKLYTEYVNIAHYRKVYKRAAFDQNL